MEVPNLLPHEIDYIEQGLALVNEAWTKWIEEETKKAEAKGQHFMFGKHYADVIEWDIRLKLGLPPLKEVREKRKQAAEAKAKEAQRKNLTDMMEADEDSGLYDTDKGE